MPKGGNGNNGGGNNNSPKPPKIIDQILAILENPADDHLVGTVTADTRADRSTWSILSGNDDGAFSIDPITGQLFVADGSIIDYETEQNRDLVVQVTENGKKDYSATVTVNISDINEAPEAGTPVEATVVETIDDTAILATVSASDPDTLADADADTTNDAFNDLTYAITGGDPDGQFKINATGNITLAAGMALDYETAQEHALEVTVTDGGGLSDTVQVTINVDDVNEAPTGLYVDATDPQLDQANGHIGVVSVIDPDQTNNYSYVVEELDENGNWVVSQRFVVTGETLQLAPGFTPDPYYSGQHDIRISATDNAGYSASHDYQIVIDNYAGISRFGSASDDIILIDHKLGSQVFAYGDGQYWNFNTIGGDDILIAGSNLEKATLVGENQEMRGDIMGGNDMLLGGDFNRTNNLVGDASLMYDTSKGGDDTIIGGDFGDVNRIYGDAGVMYGSNQGGNDTLIGGSSRVNVIHGDASQMYADSVGGNDHINGGNGGEGNHLYGDAYSLFSNSTGGDDVIFGGEGSAFNAIYGDAYEMDYQSTGGNDQLTGGKNTVNYMYGDAREMLRFSQGGDDHLTGGDLDDRLHGDALNMTSISNSTENQSVGGNDELHGGAGADELFGDAREMASGTTGGHDTLFGDDGNDALYGDAALIALGSIGGDDTLNGGAGNDDLWGNGGNDTFVFDLGSDHDTLHDMVIGEDMIDLTAYGFESTDNININDNGAGGSLVELSPTDTINVLNVTYTDLQDNSSDVFVI